MAYYRATTGAKTSLWVFNVLPYLSLATASDMTTEIPNPSSELPTFPGSNFLDPTRRHITRTGGCFRIYNDTTKGYVFAPNKYLYVDEGGAEQKIQFAVGTYTDPYDLAAEMKSKINANGVLSGDYSVTYDDRRASGDSATFKWTISRAGGNFNMNGAGKNDDILESLGFATNTDYSGAGSYTAPARACHTEEYIIIKVPDNLSDNFGSHEAGQTISCIQWLSLLDTNIRFCKQAAFADGGPKQAPKFYLYATGTPEFDDDPTGHSEGTDLFTLPMSTSSAACPSYIGIDSGLYSPSASRAGASWQRMILIDFCDWANDYNWLGSNAFIKLVVSDPQHPDGYIQLGTGPCGPAWYPGRGYNFTSTWKKVDASKVQRTGAGVRQAATKAGFYREAEISYMRSGINDGVYDAASPDYDDAPWVEFMYRQYERMIQDRYTDANTYAMTDADAAACGRGRVPFLFIDRSIDPVVGGANRAGAASGYYQTHGYTPKAMYCYFAEDPEWERQFNNRWGANFKLTEEAY